MSRLTLEKLTHYDPEIERTLWKLRKKRFKNHGPITMEPQYLSNPSPPLTPWATIGQHYLRDYTMVLVNGIHSSIRRPGFKLRTLSSSIQLSTWFNLRPNLEVTILMIWMPTRTCDTFKYIGVYNDAICLFLFLFSLR